MNEIRLKAGREKAVLRGHPWIFSGSVAGATDRDEGEFAGHTVKVVDSAGNFLAWGALSPSSKIRVRLWSRNEEDDIDPEFFHTRLEKAIKHRNLTIQDKEVDAYRLVHGESDGLPGLIVDKYGEILVVQFLACGVEHWRDLLVDQLGEITGCGHIYERSDTDTRRLEGLPPRKGWLMGGEIVTPIKIKENGLHYWVDILGGQKTGFYLDQRENRSKIREIARGRSILDCFAYTGSFTISALAGGAKGVTAVDSSGEAIRMGRENLAVNHITEASVDWIEANVFEQLRRFRDLNRKFDMVILDPPKFAPTASHAQRAARGYKDINLLALKLLNPDGLLVTFSCSGGVSEDLFQKIIAGAALDAEVQAKIINRLGPGVDHPVALNFPEGSYLKGLIVQV